MCSLLIKELATLTTASLIDVVGSVVAGQKVCLHESVGRVRVNFSISLLAACMLGYHPPSYCIIDDNLKYRSVYKIELNVKSHVKTSKAQPFGYEAVMMPKRIKEQSRACASACLKTYRGSI